MEIINTTLEDVVDILNLYEQGTAYQKTHYHKHWRGFERSLIETEIEEKRHWKIIIDDLIACTFVFTFNDPVLWKEKNNDPAIYIHRIATHPDFRGNGFVKHIIAFATQYAQKSGQKFIRMDTGSGNDKLNNYYVNCGFNFLGVIEYSNAGNMPAHYKGGSSSLFEIEIF